MYCLRGVNISLLDESNRPTMYLASVPHNSLHEVDAIYNKKTRCNLLQEICYLYSGYRKETTDINKLEKEGFVCFHSLPHRGCCYNNYVPVGLLLVFKMGDLTLRKSSKKWRGKWNDFAQMYLVMSE